MNKLKIAHVEKKPVEIRATDALRESIVTGAISPGTRITEVQISEQMNLSRATVRTALHHLAKEGLTTLVPYTGWSVISLTARDAWELYTLRSGIERLAAQLVAKNMTEAKGLKLRQAYEALVNECARGTANRIAEADFSLHNVIISLAEHTRLAAHYKLIEHQIRIYIRSSDALITDSATIIDQHRPIVEAILARDEEEAGRVSEIHNLAEGEKLSTHLSRGDTVEQLPVD